MEEKKEITAKEIMDVINRLPNLININTYCFEFSIFKNGDKDIRVCYELVCGDDYWENKYTKRV